MPTQPSLQERLARLSAAERQIVEDLVNKLEDQASAVPGPSRQPGGLRGAMHTHADFDEPLGDAFLLP
jgi:hypothetical protein